MIINHLRKYKINLTQSVKLFSTMAKFIVKNVSYMPSNPIEFSDNIAKGFIEVTKSNGCKSVIEKIYPLACSFQGNLKLHEVFCETLLQLKEATPSSHVKATFIDNYGTINYIVEQAFETIGKLGEDSNLN